MKKFRWILLSGLLVAATSVAQAQTTTDTGATGAAGTTGATTDAGAITNTTTTTTTTGVSPDGSTASNSGAFVAPDDAAMGDSDSSTDSDSGMPNTGGEPMIAVLAGLSIAGAAVAMRRKVTA